MTLFVVLVLDTLVDSTLEREGNILAESSSAACLEVLLVW